MGNDRDAVVDAELRVHGVAGLCVVDASIMPIVIGENTNPPTIMIAEKPQTRSVLDLRSRPLPASENPEGGAREIALRQ